MNGTGARNFHIAKTIVAEVGAPGIDTATEGHVICLDAGNGGVTFDQSLVQAPFRVQALSVADDGDLAPLAGEGDLNVAGGAHAKIIYPVLA